MAAMPEEKAKACFPDSIEANSFSKISRLGFFVRAYSYWKSPGLFCLNVDDKCIGGITAPVSLSEP